MVDLFKDSGMRETFDFLYGEVTSAVAVKDNTAVKDNRRALNLFWASLPEGRRTRACLTNR